MSSFYKMDPAAWDFGTSGLSLEEEAAYLRIVNAIHKHDEPVPNIDRVLAGMFRCSTRKARALVDALVTAGKLTIEGDKIWNDRARSDLLHRQFVSSSSAERGAKGGRTRAEKAAKPLETHEHQQAIASSRIEGIRIEEKKKEDPPIPPNRKEATRKLAVGVHDPVLEEFEKVWKHYPRRVGVGSARKAWVKARKQATFEEISKPLGEFIRAIRGTPIDKTPHFSTWLNQERWRDEQTHAANRPRTSDEDLDGLSRISSTDDLERLFPAPQLKVISQ